MAKQDLRETLDGLFKTGKIRYDAVSKELVTGEGVSVLMLAGLTVASVENFALKVAPDAAEQKRMRTLLKAGITPEMFAQFASKNGQASEAPTGGENQTETETPPITEGQEQLPGPNDDSPENPGLSNGEVAALSALSAETPGNEPGEGDAPSDEPAPSGTQEPAPSVTRGRRDKITG